VSTSAKAIVLVAAGFLVFANALSAPLLFDDAHAVAENPHIRQLWPLGSAMSAPPQTALSGRPVVSLSLAINYALAGGVRPFGFHLGNLCVHVAAALLLFLIVRRSLDEWTAFAVALIWLIHPLQTEVVDYVTQRTESIMGLLLLATIYFAARGWSAAAIGACALGMAAKESMVAAPLLVLACEAVVRRASMRAELRRRPRLYAGLAATWIVLAALNLPGPRSQTAGFSTPIDPSTYLVNQAPMIATYLKLAVWPAPLIVDYGPTGTLPLSAAIPGAIVVGALAVLSVVAWRRARPLGFLGLWFFATLAPSSSIVPIATEVGAERRMYLPLIALVLLAAIAIRAGTRRFHCNSRIVAGAVAAVTIALAAATVARNAVYHDPVALWRGVAEHRPHARARHAFGFALQQAGRRQEAMAQYRLAAPGYSLAHYNLALQLQAAGDPDQAAVEFRARLRAEPDDRDARGALADLLLRRGRLEEACGEYAEFIRRAPDNAAAHNNFGLALARRNRVDDAIREFEIAVALAPHDAGPRQNLARAMRAARASRAPAG
jgi:tetratricopeptide (TPR) repeat protein